MKLSRAVCWDNRPYQAAKSGGAEGAARLITADHPSVLLEGIEDATVVQVEFI